MVWTSPSRNFTDNPTEIGEAELSFLAPGLRSKLERYAFGLGMPVTETVHDIIYFLDEGGCHIDLMSLGEVVTFFLNNYAPEL